MRWTSSARCHFGLPSQRAADPAGPAAQRPRELGTRNTFAFGIYYTVARNSGANKSHSDTGRLPGSHETGK